MTEPPSEALLHQIEQALASFPADSAEYAALAPLRDLVRQGRIVVTTGPQVGAVTAARDANIATNQTILYLLPTDVDTARRQLAHLAAHYGATPDPAAVAQATATAQAWSISPGDVALVHDRLLDGVAELAQRSVDVAGLSDLAAALQATRLLLPLVAAPVDGRHLPYRWAEVIAAIGCLDLVDPLIEARRAYQASDDRGRYGVLQNLTHALTQPERQASLRLLLGYIQALADSGEAQAEKALREAITRRAAATEPAARQLWLVALAAMAGGAIGATGAMTLHALLTQPAADRTVAPPGPQADSADNQRGRAHRHHTDNPPSGNLVIPVTPAEWRAATRDRDERFGDHGLRRTPIPYWCYVRGGRYRIGGWERNEASAYVVLRPFWIARVPMTVAQYRAFIEAGGYVNDAYWTARGRAWKQVVKRREPWRWNEARFAQAMQPVIGVTWYEAAACCAWVNTHLQDLLPPGYVVRLPTEAEWEVAAAYDDTGRRRTYPWGEETPTAERADFDRDLTEEGPLPVGGRLAGAAACGALDMAGSVWEVTTSRYGQYPAGSAQREKDVPPDKWDVPWRGGSWWSDSTSVRCGARGRYYPNGDWSLNGFRLVVAPHSH
jgi:formylglycine-generating enzyme required for sulfatase activity